jgi:ABC-type phosphate transport system permease subunit
MKVNSIIVLIVSHITVTLFAFTAGIFCDEYLNNPPVMVENYPQMT